MAAPRLLTMVPDHGTPWSHTMVHHGHIPWYTMVTFHGKPWSHTTQANCTMVDHGQPWMTNGQNCYNFFLFFFFLNKILFLWYYIYIANFLKVNNVHGWLGQSESLIYEFQTNCEYK